MTTNWIIYFVTGFVLVIPLAWWGHKKLQGKPGQKKKERQDNAWHVQLVAGLLMFVFPVPMLFFYIVYRILRSRLKDIPPVCPHCGQTMELLPEAEGKRHLSPAHVFEQQIESYGHEVWRCPQCGAIEVVRVNGKNYYKYELCSQCGTYAMETVNRETVRKATWKKDGEQRNTRVCRCCGFTDYKTLTFDIQTVRYNGPEERRERDSDGGGGFGGGGSWGGGSSSGGGAGRGF